MTLTHDRRAELLGGCPLFKGIDGTAAWPRSPRSRPRSTSRPSHVIARQGEIGTGFFVVVEGRVRVVRDGEAVARARARRVLRRAVGARRRAAQRHGRRRGADAPASRSRRGTSRGPARGAGVRSRCSRVRRRRLREADADHRYLTGRPARRTRAPRPRPPHRRRSRSCSPTSRARPACSRSSAPRRSGRCSGATARSSGQRSPRHGGREDRTEGDSFFVVVRRRRRGGRGRGRRAARRSPREPWPDGVEVRVRMGLHAGEGELDAAALVGLDVNRAARIAAAAHGGQVAALRRGPRRSSRRACRRAVALRASAPPAQGPARAAAPLPARGRRPAARTSRRCARSTPGRTTCRRS